MSTLKTRGFLAATGRVVAVSATMFSMAGCLSPAISVAPRSTAQSLARIAQQADSLGAAQKAFARTHHFIGLSVQRAMDLLGDEGFQCSLKYKNLSTLRIRSNDPSSEIVPMIYCSKSNLMYGTDAVCPVFWAGFEINWRNSSLRPEFLNKEFESSLVKDEIYFCRITQDK